jgi:hypothetical protein
MKGRKIMKEKVCKYCKDEICVNAACPMRADYCPVPDTPGVCKHEERLETPPLTPQQCLSAAFEECGQPITDGEVVEIFEAMVEIMNDNGFAIKPKDPEIHQVPHEPKVIVVKKHSAKFAAGQEVSEREVVESDEWTIKSFSADPYDTSCTYMTVDQELCVRFDHSKTVGVIVPHVVNI